LSLPVLQVLYGLSSVGVIVTIVRQRQPVTCLSLFGIGIILYSLPLFWGYTVFITAFVPRPEIYYEQLCWQVYAVFFGCQAVFYLACIFEPVRADTPKEIDPRIFTAMSISIILWTVVSFAILGASKLFVSKSTRVVPVTYDFARTITVALMICLALYRTRRAAVHICVVLAFAIIDTYLGYRLTVFLGSCSFLLARFANRTSIGSIRQRTLLIVSAIFFISAAFVYKPIYYALDIGLFDWSKLGTYATASVVGSEPFIITGLLNESFEHDLQLPADYALKSVAQYFPFYEHFVSSTRMSFNDVVQKERFPNVTWGLASTCFGELYTVGGWLLIVAYLVGQFLFLRLRPPSTPIAAVFYYSIAPNFIFYNYRCDWLFPLGVIRYCIMCLILLVVVFECVKGADVFLQLRRYSPPETESRAPSAESISVG
jgi:hypothetical protein